MGSISLTRSDTTLTVSWNAVDGAAKYHALYQADGAGDWLPPVPDYQNITATGFTFNVDNGKSYVVGVRAGNSAGWGPWTDSPASGPYTPVQQITVTATRGEDGDTAGVSWDAYAGDNFEHYRVIVCDDSQYNGASCVGTVWTGAPVWDANSTGPVSVPDLDPGTGYGVILQTWHNGSALKSHATLPAGPAAPTNLSVTPGDYYLDIAWNTVSGATGYDVRAKTAGSTSWHSVASNITTTSHRYTTSATIDYVAVRARNANGPGNWAELSRMPGRRLHERRHRRIGRRRIGTVRRVRPVPVGHAHVGRHHARLPQDRRTDPGQLDRGIGRGGLQLRLLPTGLGLVGLRLG